MNIVVIFIIVPCVSVWDVEEGSRLVTEHYNSQARITAAEFINPHDITFLLTGSGQCPPPPLAPSSL